MLLAQKRLLCTSHVSGRSQSQNFGGRAEEARVAVSEPRGETTVTPLPVLALLDPKPPVGTGALPAQQQRETAEIRAEERERELLSALASECPAIRYEDDKRA